jgi:hypothetical protein
MSESPFKIVESDAQVPDELKKSLVSEIDTIRNVSTLIELFVGNFINTLTKSLSSDSIDDNSTNSKA